MTNDDMNGHMEWLAGHIASLQETPKKVLTPFEEGKARLQRQSEARTRRLVIDALGDFYRKGETPGKQMDPGKETDGIELHPQSDHVRRIKHGSAFTTL